ncbi:Beta-lactamase superfamily domain-containing protein [Streptomyces sp. WMMB 322]|nr:Beta-lactamase superfamily domain-containing protein [Streptomyces sp. WMMB 322]
MAPGPLRLTLLGVGAMNSPRFAPAGLLLRHGGHRVVFDGGPGAGPPVRPEAWLVTDEHAELRSELRRMAAGDGLVAHAGDLDLDGGGAGGPGRAGLPVSVRACPVVHTSHSAYGYRIECGGLLAVWAPEFKDFPEWAAGADLLFADASSWNRPIRFRGGAGGHASVHQVGAEAVRHGVRRVVYAHIGRPCIRAMDAGLTPEVGEWGREGRTYTLRPRPGEGPGD